MSKLNVKVNSTLDLSKEGEKLQSTSQIINMQTGLKASDVFLNQVELDKNWSRNMSLKKGLKISIPRGYGRNQIEERWKLLNSTNDKYKEYFKANGEKLKSEKGYRPPMEELLDKDTLERCDVFRDNIENMIGTVKVPVGVAGPIRINGLFAQGDYYVPLATTEAALVASINRGISAINAAGGVTAAVIAEGISRDPVLCFKDLIEVGNFLSWASKSFLDFKKEAEKSTRFGKLVECRYTIEGNQVHMKCVYTTGDASGQNIITIATENIVNYIQDHSPVKPKQAFVEGGMSGDKKANASVLTGVRGKRVIAEVKISKDVVWSTLHASPEELVASAQVGTRGLYLNGTLGFNAHFANPITAMAIALGQDPACSSESHVGIARNELLAEDSSIYISVTCPNLLVGTVGGGTKLPSQRACLELMGLLGNGCANALAEVMAGVILAGELSLGAAIVSGDFAKAHKILARDSREPIDMEKDTVEEAFEKAQALVVKLTVPPSKEVLNIYGLYKQATSGDIHIDRPGLFSTDFRAKAKYDAWASKKGIKKEEAMKEYIKVVLDLVAKQQEAASSSSSKK